MGYNQNRIAALNTSKPLGVRYKSFLRCVSSICNLSGLSFKTVLNTINPTFTVPGNKANLAELIYNSMDKLDSHRSGRNIIRFEQKVIIAAELSTNGLGQDHAHSNENAFPKCFYCINAYLSKQLKSVKTQVENFRTSRQVKIELYKEYRLLTPVIESRAKELFHTINVKLKHEEKCLAFPVQHRIKTWDSINEKIGRVKFPMKSVTEMQDLIGFRVVTVFERDIYKIIKIVEKNYNVVRKYLPKKHKGENNYYTSLHIVIDSHKHGFLIPRSNAEKKILTEIQIMTLAQYTFAKASHLLHYKKNAPITENSIRALQRTSALLETVDLEFERILEDHQQ